MNRYRFGTNAAIGRLDEFMKAGVIILLLAFFVGCEHSSRPTNPAAPISTQSVDTLPSVSTLYQISSQFDSVHAIDFTWKDSVGKLDSLSEFRGKKVLLNFWATWCPPCQEEIPALENVAAKAGDSLHVIGVSVDRTPNTVQTVSDFAIKNGMNYRIIVDSTYALFGRYIDEYHGSPGIPQTWIIARDGTVSSQLLGPQSEQTFDSCLARAK